MKKQFILLLTATLTLSTAFAQIRVGNKKVTPKQRLDIHEGSQDNRVRIWFNTQEEYDLQKPINADLVFFTDSNTFQWLSGGFTTGDTFVGGDFFADGSVPMSGILDMDFNSISSVGSIDVQDFANLSNIFTANLEILERTNTTFLIDHTTENPKINFKYYPSSSSQGLLSEFFVDRETGDLFYDLDISNSNPIKLNSSSSTSGIGDNLGNHVATEDLQMQTFSIRNLKGITGMTSNIVMNGSGQLHQYSPDDLKWIRYGTTNNAFEIQVYTRLNDNSSFNLESELQYDFAAKEFRIDNDRIATTADLNGSSVSNETIDSDLENIPNDGTLEGVLQGIDNVFSTLTFNQTPINLNSDRFANDEDLNSVIQNRTSTINEITIPRNFGSIGDIIKFKTLTDGGIIKPIPDNGVTFLNYRETTGEVGSYLLLEKTGVDEWTNDVQSSSQEYTFIPPASSTQVTISNLPEHFGTSTGSNHSSVIVNYPSSLVNGSLMRLDILIRENAVIDTPNGWTLANSQSGSNVNANNGSISDLTVATFYKDVLTDGSETVPFTVTSNAVNTNSYVTLVTQLENVTLPNIFESLVLLPFGANGTNFTQPVVTSTQDLSLQLDLVFIADNLTPTPANGMTEIFSVKTTNGNDTGITLYSRNIGQETSLSSDYIFSSGEIGGISSMVINPN